MNKDAVKALASFLTKSQASMSIVISMPGNEGLARSWYELREKLELSGWHDEKEAKKAIERAFYPPATKE